MPSSVSWSSGATLRPTYERILPQWMRQREPTATSSAWDRTHQQVLNGQNTNRTAAAAAFNPVTTSAYWPDIPELTERAELQAVYEIASWQVLNGQNTYRTAAATTAAFNPITTSAVYWPDLPELTERAKLQALYEIYPGDTSSSNMLFLHT